MGFGRGKGFTSRVMTEMTKYLVRSGGGKASIALVELVPTYGIKYGGGKAIALLTSLVPTYGVKYGGGKTAKVFTELNPTYETEIIEPPSPITIGAPAIVRGYGLGAGYTVIIRDNPASEAFTITKAILYTTIAMTGAKVATFYKTNGNTFSTRNTQTIGNIPLGYSEQDVSIGAEAGDYIGMYYPVGGLYRELAGFAGIWLKSGDNIPCTGVVFSLYSGDILSLGGSGTS